MINHLLWGMQGLLCGLFALTGGIKLLQPAAKVRQLAPPTYSLSFLRMLGALEVLAAVGVIVPWFTGILPMLTPMAAAAMALVLVFAMRMHLQQREPSRLPFLVLMLCCAVAVALLRNPTTR